MAIDTTLIKRQALYKGEVGFFPSSPMAEEDIAPAKMNEELLCSFSSPRTLQQLKYLWALCQKTAENCDLLTDKDDAMAKFKLGLGYTKVVYNPKSRKLEAHPRSLRRMSFEQLRKFTDQVVDLICTEYIPGMEEGVLRDEIEAMIAPTSIRREEVG